MEKKRSVEVTIFEVLMILGVLIQFPVEISSYSILLKPLPEPVIIARYFTIKLLLILGFISGIGILWLKGIFRRIAIFLSILNIIDYIIILPLLILKNVPDFINQEIVKVIAMHPANAQHLGYSTLWNFVILGCVIDIGFTICVIYFFTRPKVKEQFK